MARAPFAVWRPIPSDTDPAIEPVGVILHVDGGNAYSLYNWFSGPSGGIESHFHISRDGRIEQYRRTDQEADANYRGNSFMRDGRRVGFISIETQGYASGEWTDAQLTGIKRLLTWIDETHPLVQLRECPGPFEPGVGYHVMFGAPGPWTPSAKTCPGPDRIRQFNNIIVPWMEEDMVDRNTNVGPNPTLAEDFDKLRDAGVYTKYTEPGGVVFKDELAAFLNRYQAKIVQPAITKADQTARKRIEQWVKDHVKTSIAAALAAGAGAGQIDYPELIRRIGEILAGG